MAEYPTYDPTSRTNCKPQGAGVHQSSKPAFHAFFIPHLWLPLLDNLLDTFSFGTSNVHQVELFAKLVQKVKHGLRARVVLQAGLSEQSFTTISLEYGKKARNDVLSSAKLELGNDDRTSLTWKTVPCTGSTGGQIEQVSNEYEDSGHKRCRNLPWYLVGGLVLSTGMMVCDTVMIAVK
jgi:hypothetical protein